MSLILLPAAAALVLATVCALAARLWWGFELFSHFRLQYLVVAVILGVVALATGAVPIAAMLAVVALVHGQALRNLWRGGRPAAAGGIRLRVLCFNVLAANRTPDAVTRLVRASDADLVILVEAKRWRWRQVIADLGAAYPHRVPQGWPEEPPVFVLSRHPIVGQVAAGGRRALLAVEVLVGGRTLVVAAVHAPVPCPGAVARRRHELDRCVESLTDTDRPMIVAGDFNATPWSPRFRDLLRTGLRNAADGQGYVATWPRWLWPAQIPIDHLLLKGPWAVIGFRRGPAAGSDHYPIIADLCLPPDG